MRALPKTALLIALALAGGCSSSAAPAGGGPDADASTRDAGAALTSCLEPPAKLARSPSGPPSGRLPCELLPPDFAAR